MLKIFFFFLSEGQPESIVQDIENMIHSYVDKVVKGKLYIHCYGKQFPLSSLFFLFWIFFAVWWPLKEVVSPTLDKQPTEEDIKSSLSEFKSLLFTSDEWTGNSCSRYVFGPF